MDGFHAKAGAEDAVERGGGTAALQVAEAHVAGLVTGDAFHFLGDEFTDAAKFDLTTVGVHLVAGHQGAVFELGSFGDDDEDAAMALRIELRHVVGDILELERNLRKQNDVRTATDRAIQGDPASVTAHDFHDHDALMAVGSGVKTVQGIHHRSNGGVETECHRGGLEIVVDGLGNADDRHAFAAELQTGGQGAVSTDDDERADAEVFDRGLRLIHDLSGNERDVVDAYFGGEVPFVRGSEDGAAQFENADGVFGIELDVAGTVGEQSFKAIAEADDFPAEF